MKIEKYKFLKNNRYEVIIDNEKYILYEDIIINNGILLKKEISKKELDEFLKDNLFYEAYYKSLKYISIKYRIDKEIYKYLSKDYDSNIINKVIDKLKKDGYINEVIYTKSYINDCINLKIVGPLKIKKDLIDLGVNIDIIEKELFTFNDQLIKEKVNKIINKEVKLNKNKSLYMLKNKISLKLMDLGYSREDFKYLLDDISIDEDDLYKKEYDKLYKKLSLKYSGNELEYKIKEKMYMKGFRV